MSVRSSPMPPTSCGARTAFGCSRWNGWGWVSPPSSIGTPSASAGMCASEATASPPFSRSPWGLRGCMPRPPPVRRGGWPCGWITAPSICRTTSPTRSLGHPAVLRLRRTAPDQRRRREVQSHAQGTDHPWPHLPAELRNAVRGFVEQYNAQYRGEERLSPGSSGVARCHGPPHETNLCPRNRVRYLSEAMKRGLTVVDVRPDARRREGHGWILSNARSAFVNGAILECSSISSLRRSVGS